MSEQLELLSRDATQHNVFFAALPDAALISSAVDIARRMRLQFGLSASPIPPERLHVSLVPVGGFSGSCPSAVIDAAVRAAGTVSVAPFKVEFDRVATFTASRGRHALVLTGHDDSIAGFTRLNEALRDALMKTGLKPPRQSNSSPHLTLMYERQACNFPVEPIGWTVNRFALVDSLVGQSRHMHLGEWSL